MSEMTGGATYFRRIEQHRDRWKLFGAGTGITFVSDMLSPEELATFEVFADYDEEFLRRISPDVSVAAWEEGAILFEEGTYIDLAFVIVEGTVALTQERVERPQQQRPIFDARRTMLEPRPEAARPAGDGKRRPDRRNTQASTRPDQTQVTMLAMVDFDMPRDAVVMLGPGEVFGEIGALNGWPQSVTARAETACHVVQIRVPALRLMKRKSKAFKERIDSVYRARSLRGHLRSAPLFTSCPESLVDQLAERVELVSCAPDEVVVQEGEPADAFFLVRSGFMKLAQRVGTGEIAVSYLSKGMTFGETELLIDGVDGWAFTVSSVGHSELVKISRDDFDRILAGNPQIEPELWEQVVARLKEAGSSRKHPERARFLRFSLDQGLVEGSSILAIDLSICTRCDDCVRACADTHGGRARFIREGERYENLLIAKSCYQCRDPVCLIGCPTGAIRRANVGDVVEIADEICIGCTACASACPYDAIVMHDTGTNWPDDAVPKSLRGKQRKVASKCDLCHTDPKGPACVRNCPQGCAFRVGSIDEFPELMRKVGEW
jgi:CRP-like cAMP-binding protein/Pyruvate/2-oxoacid:ferredoxin oxidoreductase delta subunit